MHFQSVAHTQTRRQALVLSDPSSLPEPKLLSLAQASLSSLSSSFLEVKIKQYFKTVGEEVEVKNKVDSKNETIYIHT